MIAPTLSLYGLGLLVVAGVLVARGDPAGLSFGGYGTALAVAAVSYQRRTRPVCAVA